MACATCGPTRSASYCWCTARALKNPQYLEQARTLVADVDRVDSLHSYFDGYRSGDEYDREAITHVMACSSHLPGYLMRGYA